MSETETLGRYVRLFGERTGIINGISHLPPDRGAPPVYVHSPSVTDIAELCGVDETEIDLTSISGKGFTVEESLLTCVGETAERYCYYFPDPPSELVHGSYDELSARRETIPYEYLDAYNLETAPRIEDLDRETPLRWAAGESMLDGRTVLLPDSLVWFHPDRSEKYFVSTSNGCAAGQSADQAVTGSILEAVERDAMMRTWCLQSTPTVIEGCPASVEPLVSEFTKFGHDVTFFLLDSTVDLPVVGCLARNGRDGLPKCVLACSADLTVAEAMKGALVEVGQGWAFADNVLVDHDLHEVNEKDRFESFEENFVYYTCGDGTEDLRRLFEGGDRVSVDDVPDVGDRQALVDRLEAADCTPLLFDLTTRDVRDAGIVVTRVFVPELVPLTPPSDLPTKHPELADRDVTGMAHPIG